MDTQTERIFIAFNSTREALDSGYEPDGEPTWLLESTIYYHQNPPPDNENWKKTRIHVRNVLEERAQETSEAYVLGCWASRDRRTVQFYKKA